VARPRKITDEDVMAACGRAIGRHGPAFTLAQVAAEAGVAVGTVAGRFGSKQGLLLAMTTAQSDVAEERMAAAAARHTDPVAAVLAALLVATDGVDDPATATNHLAQLGVDLADPALRAGLAVLRARVHRALAGLLTAFPRAPGNAARILAAMTHGAQLDWALEPKGRIGDRVRDDVTAILETWR
jgi:AcrR family transcriptional regulator